MAPGYKGQTAQDASRMGPLVHDGQWQAAREIGRREGDGRRTPIDHHKESLPKRQTRHAPPEAGHKHWGSSFKHHKFEGGKAIDSGHVDLMSSGSPFYNSGQQDVTYLGEQRAGALPKQWVAAEKAKEGRHSVPPPVRPRRPISNWIWEELQACAREGERVPSPKLEYTK